MAKAKKEEKKPKRKVETRFGFQKDVFHQKKQDVVNWVLQEGVDVRCVEHGFYDDGTEFMNIVIEGFKS